MNARTSKLLRRYSFHCRVYLNSLKRHWHTLTAKQRGEWRHTATRLLGRFA